MVYVILPNISKANRKQCNRLVIPQSYNAFAEHLESDNCLAILCMEGPKIPYKNIFNRHIRALHIYLATARENKMEINGYIFLGLGWFGGLFPPEYLLLTGQSICKKLSPKGQGIEI